ncbi:MAG: hypothetical protein HC834_06550 [Rhodospirillales bacterium]|nr:hypothetical protein [Rhodospirillales bacterium]
MRIVDETLRSGECVSAVARRPLISLMTLAKIAHKTTHPSG